MLNNNIIFQLHSHQHLHLKKELSKHRNGKDKIRSNKRILKINSSKLYNLGTKETKTHYISPPFLKKLGDFETFL